ncbi:hypothetical protein K1T71_002276 [Dendrolimus kikuchii]|uniref:Uncharacterized protein n=1 Tax=Dendrolimus kikuchii TaxID=765133 RepID=A0ACC1DCU2_9NEOP|nr:hypothetical protein K1T71_002276 [Dendrolimus kikuchii]
MLQIVIYCLLMFLTLLAIFDIIRLCVSDQESMKKRLRLWNTPYEIMKNKIQGIKELKEEPSANTAADRKIQSISEIAIGAVTLFFGLMDFFWSILELMSSYLMPFFLPAEVQPLVKRFGTWAVVTGGTDGIGKHYALELAKRGINVIIISRNIDKLKSVASEIALLNSPPQTYICVLSYPNIKYRLVNNLFQRINNVGCQYDYPMLLCEVSSNKSWELINVNVGAVTVMTKMVLPGMVQRGKGAVVNVSSGAELQPMPLMAVYAATKSYVASFTQAIREEYSPKGIYVQHLSPMFVSTKMNAFSQRVMDGNMFIPDAPTYSKNAVALLGRITKTTGYWSHGIQYTITSIAPCWLRMKLSGILNRNLRYEHDMNSKVKSN